MKSITCDVATSLVFTLVALSHIYLTNVDAAEAKSAEEKAAEVTKEEKTQKIVKDGLKADDVDLRKMGISITSGMGYIADHGKVLPSLQVRYNFIQNRVTEYYYMRQANGAAAANERVEEKDYYISPKYITGISLFGGYGLSEIAIDSKPGSSSRPYLIGASLGLGRGNQASSSVNIDAGWCISDSGKFKQDGHLYVGVSLDLVVLEVLKEKLSGLISSKK